MAALTRIRANVKTGVPCELHAKYYSERAESAAFVLSECSPIDPRGNAIPGSCGIYSKEQIKGWQKVTDEVHKVNGKIFLQLWHCGRAGTTVLLDGLPLAPSKVKNREFGWSPQGKVEYDMPIEMTKSDIDKVINQFRKAAENAKEAGADGVELHGANGYLIDQFIRDATNKRTDEYGGSVENRCRFPLLVLDQLIDVFKADKVGMKLTPIASYNDMFDSDPIKTFSHLIKELNKRKIAFVELVGGSEISPSPNLYGIKGEDQIPDVFSTFRPHFSGVLIGNNGLTFESGNKLISEGKIDMVSFGRWFLANPDLAEKFKKGWELNKPDPSTFYTPGPKGYIDYPKHGETRHIKVEECPLQ